MPPALHVLSSAEHVARGGWYSDVFIACHVLGLIGCILVLVTGCFSKVKRQFTWYNFFVSWGLFSLSYSLLLFTGHLYENIPDFGLCLFQSAITYAAPLLACGATLALVAELYINVVALCRGQPAPQSNIRVVFFSMIPYVLAIGVMLEASAIGLINRSKATFSTEPYCSLESPIPGRVTASLSIMMMVPVLVLNCIIVYHVRKHSQAMHNSRALWGLCRRVFLFAFFGLVAVLTCLLFFFIVFVKNNKLGLALLNIVLGSGPIAALVVFATHKDLLDVWIGWFTSLGRCLTNRGAPKAESVKPLPKLPVEVAVSLSVRRDSLETIVISSKSGEYEK